MDARLLNPLIHIGYHKTGSTWLQKHLFDNPERGFFRLSGKIISKNHVGLKPTTRFSRKFVFEPGGSIYAPGEFSVDRMSELLSECNVQPSGVAVLSDERLSGQPETGGFDSYKICKRLSKVFNSPKIFIVIREQKSLIASCYMDFLLKGGTESLLEYMNPTEGGSPKFKKSYLEFHHLISKYFEIFKKENVLVLPYEMFRDNPEDYFIRLGDFAGVEIPRGLPVKERVNAKINTYWESKFRYFNWLTRQGSPYGNHPLYMGKTIHKLGRSISKRLMKLISEENEKKERSEQKNIIEKSIGELYKESNKKTSEMIGINLNQYNY
jgi:hypothetical protein